MNKQCRAYDVENDVFIGGIILDDATFLCGCCGAIIPPDEIDVENCENFDILDDDIRKELLRITDSYKQIKLLEIYPYWVSLSDEIIGE